MGRIAGLTVVLGMLAWGSVAQAATITLDFETAATGSTLISSPLVTPDGTITLTPGLFGSVSLAFSPTGRSLAYSLNPMTGTAPAVLTFGFDVQSVAFNYAGGGGGSFSATVRDAGAVSLDSFFDPSTACTSGCFDGTVTLNGPAIRSFEFRDTVSSVSAIDNFVITFVPIPEPTTLLLFGTGLAMGAIRRRRKQ